MQARLAKASKAEAATAILGDIALDPKLLSLGAIGV
jgi:hypothetical protein